MHRKRPPQTRDYVAGVALFCLFWAISAGAVSLAVNGIGMPTNPFLPYGWCSVLGAANAVLWIIQWSDKS